MTPIILEKNALNAKIAKKWREGREENGTMWMLGTFCRIPTRKQ